MKLRPYQARAIAELWSLYRAGKRAVLLVSPTGSGKTFTGASVASAYIERHLVAGGSVVWIAHRDELVDQAAAALRRLGLDVGARGLNASAPVQVRMVQSLTRRGEVPDGTLVVLDECHHYAGANRWTDVARAYLAAEAKILGLTATPARADGQALHGFDGLVAVAQIRELTGVDQPLVPLIWRGPPYALPVGRIARTPAVAWELAAKGRRTIVFGQTIDECQKHAEEFRALPNAPSVAVVSERCSPDERRDVLRRLATGALDVVCNVAVLTEGFDCPGVSCVIVARRVGSIGLLVQMVGRGLRAVLDPSDPDGMRWARNADGGPVKADCRWLDLCGLAHSMGRVDEDKHYHLDGEGITLAAGPKAVGLRLCRVCGAPLPEESTVCVECGKDHSPIEMRSAEESLVEWQTRYSAAKAALQPSRGALALAGIMRKAKVAADEGKPWKPAAIRFRFAAIFKREPSSDEMRQAQTLNRAAETFPVEETGGVT